MGILSEPCKSLPRVTVGDRSVAAVGLRLTIKGRALARYNLTILKAEGSGGEQVGIMASTTQSRALRHVLDVVPILQMAEVSPGQMQARGTYSS